MVLKYLYFRKKFFTKNIKRIENSKNTFLQENFVIIDFQIKIIKKTNVTILISKVA